MNKEELYELALSDVPKYSLLNEIFAIRDTRIKEEDYDICVNGFISLDVLNKYIDKVQQIDKATNYYLKTLAEYNKENKLMPKEAVDIYNILEGNK